MTSRQEEALALLRRYGKITSKGVRAAGFRSTTFDALVRAGLATRAHRAQPNASDSFDVWRIV